MVLNVEQSDLSVTGSFLDLTGFANPLVVELRNGAYHERVEIHLKAKPGPNGKSTFSY